MSAPARDVKLYQGDGNSPFGDLAVKTPAPTNPMQHANEALPAVERKQETTLTPREPTIPKFDREISAEIKADHARDVAQQKATATQIATNTERTLSTSLASSTNLLSNQDIALELEREGLRKITLTRSGATGRDVFSRIVNFAARFLKRLEQKLSGIFKKKNLKIAKANENKAQKDISSNKTLRQSRIQPMERVHFDDDDNDQEKTQES